MKLACSTVFVCFYYSTSFSNDDFSSVKNSTQEARLLKNDILRLKFRHEIYKPSHTALRTKARLVKVKHDLLHIVLQVNQSKT